MLEKLERLAAAGIQILPAPGVSNHFFLERDGFVALVKRAGDDFGAAGSAGLLTDHGFAVLIWRGEQGYFVARGYEKPAEPEQVEKLRRFDADVRAVLG
jgi:hypothetical protein